MNIINETEKGLNIGQLQLLVTLGMIEANTHGYVVVHADRVDVAMVGEASFALTFFEQRPYSSPKKLAQIIVLGSEFEAALADNMGRHERQELFDELQGISDDLREAATKAMQRVTDLRRSFACIDDLAALAQLLDARVEGTIEQCDWFEEELTEAKEK